MTHGAAPQLLLVEDNPGDAELIMDLLSESLAVHDPILHVSSLTEAIEDIKSRDVAAVLLDLRLPDGSGVECVSAIRALADELPIVVLTGVDDDDLAMRCIRAGAQDYLSKQEVRGPALKRAIGYAIARATEASLRRRADSLQYRLAAIVESSSDAILSLTAEGIVTAWNASATRIFGTRATEAVGRPAHELLPQVVDDLLALALDGDVRAAIMGQSRECSWVREGGGVVHLSLVVNPLVDSSGRFLGVAAIGRDISDQKGLETQLAVSDRMVTIGTLAAGVAHEINNPLAALVMNLELATEQATAPDRAGKMEDVLLEIREARESAERVRQIVRDLKVLSRVEDLPRGPVDVRAVIQSTLRIAMNEIRHRARLRTELPDVPPVDANEGRLGQVILNLLLNAAQAIPEGNHDANEIAVSTSTDGAGRVTICIADTGSGMPPEVQKRIFTAFYTTKAVGEGTGLGLVISQRIVSSFGGQISFESEVGKGSRFSIALPAYQPTGASGRPTSKSVGPSRPARVLVIDDERSLLRAVERALGARHEVTAVDSGAEALRRLRAGERFDVILCDVMMPQMTGLELHAHLRHLAAGDDERVVFMTGGAFTARAREELDRLPNRKIDKPFDVAILSAIVSESVR